MRFRSDMACRCWPDQKTIGENVQEPGGGQDGGGAALCHGQGDPGEREPAFIVHLI